MATKGASCGVPLVLMIVGLCPCHIIPGTALFAVRTVLEKSALFRYTIIDLVCA